MNVAKAIDMILQYQIISIIIFTSNIKRSLILNENKSTLQIFASQTLTCFLNLRVELLKIYESKNKIRQIESAVLYLTVHQTKSST